MNKTKLFAATAILSLCASFVPYNNSNAQIIGLREITFPVIGPTSFGNDFADPRDGGSRTHEGNDIFGKKMQPLVAAVDGTVSFVAYPQASWGYSVTIRDKDGFSYHYLHINNDNPGTDDGKGDGMNAYALDVQRGDPVVKGQLIGYMGDSGNAETTSPHLHFEIRMPGGEPINPYQSLKSAIKISAPVINNNQLPREILPYADFKGGANIASGLLDSDNQPDIITGAGPTGGPLVKVFKQDKTQLAAFYAYAPNFGGGIDVAAGDIDGDGRDEIITSPLTKGGPHIKVFKLDGTVVKEFYAYDPNFHGGVFVSAADLDDDGKDEIITGPNKGGGPHVKVFNGSGQVVKEFFAYDSNFHGGVDVAGFAKTGITNSGIVTAPGAGGGPHIKIFNFSGSLASEFFAYEGNYSIGVRVSAGNIKTGNTGPEVVVMPATAGSPHMKVFGIDGAVQESDMVAFEPWWRGGFDVTVAGDELYVSSTSGRRASVRNIED